MQPVLNAKNNILLNVCQWDFKLNGAIKHAKLKYLSVSLSKSVVKFLFVKFLYYYLNTLGKNIKTFTKLTELQIKP